MTTKTSIPNTTLHTWCVFANNTFGASHVIAAQYDFSHPNESNIIYITHVNANDGTPSVAGEIDNITIDFNISRDKHLIQGNIVKSIDHAAAGVFMTWKHSNNFQVSHYVDHQYRNDWKQDATMINFNTRFSGVYFDLSSNISSNHLIYELSI